MHTGCFDQLGPRAIFLPPCQTVNLRLFAAQRKGILQFNCHCLSQLLSQLPLLITNKLPTEGILEERQVNYLQKVLHI